MCYLICKLVKHKTNNFMFRYIYVIVSLDQHRMHVSHMHFFSYLFVWIELQKPEVRFVILTSLQCSSFFSVQCLLLFKRFYETFKIEEDWINISDLPLCGVIVLNPFCEFVFHKEFKHSVLPLGKSMKRLHFSPS